MAAHTMTLHIARALTGLALATTLSSGWAAEVTISGWAFGSGNAVNVSGSGVPGSGYTGAAGGFTGKLTGAGSFDSNSFLAYCIELEEQLSFGASAVSGYTVLSGTSYFDTRRSINPSRPDGPSTATRLGQLVTWAQADPTRVDTAGESTAMQLAIWNIVYDTDWTVAATSGSFRDSSSYQSLATQMLQGASGVTSQYTISALSLSGKQDLLLATRNGAVPTPGTLALVGLGLAGAVMVLRKRRG